MRYINPRFTYLLTKRGQGGGTEGKPSASRSQKKNKIPRESLQINPQLKVVFRPSHRVWGHDLDLLGSCGVIGYVQKNGVGCFQVVNPQQHTLDHHEQFFYSRHVLMAS